MQNRCQAQTRSGEQCKRNAEEDSKYCYQHRSAKKSNNSSEVGQNKLNDNQKELLLLWLAEGKKPKEITGLIKDEFNLDYDPSSVSYYKSKYKDEILKKQKEISKYISINVKLANKSSRIEELENLYNESIRQNKLDTARRVLKLIAEEMGELEENININTTAKEGIMAAYKRRKKRESNDQ